MCILRAHIKPSIFRNIFSEIEKVLSFFNFRENISKNGWLNVCLKGTRHTLAKFIYKIGNEVIHKLSRFLLALSSCNQSFM